MAKLIELTKVLDWKKLLEGVREEDEEYIIQEGKNPVAVVMPFESYKHLARLEEEGRKRLFEIIERIQARAKNENPQEIEALVDDAVTSVRSKKHS